MPLNDKLKSIDELADLIAAFRSSHRTTVHCHGVFDLLHIGHIDYLEKAKQLGEVLVVTITSDQFVNKGPHRPTFDERLRATAIAALECVDYVALSRSPTATEAIELLKPDVYAKGAEFRDHKTPELEREEAAATGVGTRMEFIEGVTSSSSHLINRYLSPFNDDTERYLQWFKCEHTATEINEFLDKAHSLKVLVVGEAIIDEYYSCETLGRSSKAPIVATRYESHQRFAGGALAVANHLAGFCGDVGLLSMLGQKNREEKWIHAQLRDNVAPTFIYKSDAPTIVKRRYRESYFGIPLFAINFLDDDPLTEQESTSLCEKLEHLIKQYDAVVVADYGHAMLGDLAIQLLCDESRFLAVNTQANAANVGFHTISKYPRADYVSLAEQELELECRTHARDLESMLLDVGQRLYANTISVTLGSRGSLCYKRRAGYHASPSLATNVVDRVGAGDAFFAVTSLCAVLDAPLEILGFLGNVAGAEAAATLCNSQYLDALPFQRHIESLLK